MHQRLNPVLVFLLSLGLLPGLAQGTGYEQSKGCGTLPLTSVQAAYLDTQQLEIANPDGNVPFVQRCDIDDNEVIDLRDIKAIRANRGNPAAHPDDPMDWNGDSKITRRDAKACRARCTHRHCIVKRIHDRDHGWPTRKHAKWWDMWYHNDRHAEDDQRSDRNHARDDGRENRDYDDWGDRNGDWREHEKHDWKYWEHNREHRPGHRRRKPVGSPGKCFQARDFDGDGKRDLMAVVEYTGAEFRAFNWDLQVIILTEDQFGNVEHVIFPFTGQVTDEDTDLRQHLSLQPAGTVNLLPGSTTIDQPGVVSYRDGEPRTLYFFRDGALRRAFYGIDD